MKKSLDSDIRLGKKTYPIIVCRQINQSLIEDLIAKSKNNVKNTMSELKEFILENNIDEIINDKINSLYLDAFNIVREINFKNTDLINFTKLISKRTK